MTANKQKESQLTEMLFILDNEETQVKVPKSTTILDAALGAGLDAPFSCQGGFCTSCVAVLSDGKATMEENTTLNDDEIAEGKTLTCVTRVATDKLTINFDI